MVRCNGWLEGNEWRRGQVRGNRGKVDGSRYVYERWRAARGEQE